MFYLKKKFFLYDEFNTSFSTFVNTLFCYLNASSSFLFLGLCQIKYEIITRYLRNCSKQKLFLELKTSIVSIFNHTNAS